MNTTSMPPSLLNLTSSNHHWPTSWTHLAQGHGWTCSPCWPCCQSRPPPPPPHRCRPPAPARRRSETAPSRPARGGGTRARACAPTGRSGCAAERRPRWGRACGRGAGGRAGGVCAARARNDSAWPSGRGWLQGCGWRGACAMPAGELAEDAWRPSWAPCRCRLARPWLSSDAGAPRVTCALLFTLLLSAPAIWLEQLPAPS